MDFNFFCECESSTCYLHLQCYRTPRLQATVCGQTQRLCVVCFMHAVHFAQGDIGVKYGVQWLDSFGRLRFRTLEESSTTF